MEKDLKAHWENVYHTKSPQEVSWTQPVPQTSLDLIHQAGGNKSASIIDIGGGDSLLADHLLAQGYLDITVLDISAEALERAKKRLGPLANKVNWIVSDINHFVPTRNYDIWHDRAAFHFLTTPEAIAGYTGLVKKYVNQWLAIGTFSPDGPEKCSGLFIKRYDEAALTLLFQPAFSKTTCFTEDHVTPFNTKQNFIFCAFEKQTT